jgi:hypothetical protein
MKMKLTGFLAFTLLSLSILSYGVSGSAFATIDPNPALAISSDFEFYSNGETVIVSGLIGDYDPLSLLASDLVYVISTPAGNIAQVGQLGPGSDGYFDFSFVVGGPLWKTSGEYIVDVTYVADKSTITIYYTVDELEPIPEPVVEPEPEPVVEPEPEPVVEPEPEPVVEPESTCGAGTELVDGICQITQIEEPTKKGGGCLIATAAFGTELAPQVQFLREIRDNTVMSTASGASFMTGFNQLYYSFSPTIADMERANPMFQEVVRAFITPMISSLSIMTLADSGSEVEVLGLGVSVIMLNLGMYIAAPALVGFKVHKHFKSRK